MATFELIWCLLMLTARVQWTNSLSIPSSNHALIPRASAPNIVAFYSYADDLPPEQIDASLLTHIITFGQITNNTLSGDTDLLSRLVNLKNQNSNLKVLLAISGSTQISEIVHSPSLTDSFIQQSQQYLIANQLDGLDIDWEFPAWGGDPLDSRDLFPVFLQKFLTAATNLSNTNGLPRLLLTADVAAPATIMDVSYNITEMAKYIDFVNIMCYDFHFYTWYDILTGSNAPLYNRSDEKSTIVATMNTAWASSEWNSRGMPKSKINVGIPTYGHTYNLSDPLNHGFDALTTGPGADSGWITYPKVCRFVENGGSIVYDEESQIPYGYHDYDWISFDNIESFDAKTRYILDNDYAGTMVFSMNSDDYLAVCDGQTRFPLIQTVYNITKTYF